jgi:hypothetical protein
MNQFPFTHHEQIDCGDTFRTGNADIIAMLEKNNISAKGFSITDIPGSPDDLVKKNIIHVGPKLSQELNHKEVKTKDRHRI